MSDLDAEINLDDIPDDVPYVNTDCAAAVGPGPSLEMEVERASGREYPPAALAAIYTLIDPHYRTMRRSGIVGDAGHKRGYHRARAIVSSSDYSVQAPADKRGDSWACAGIDVSFGPAEMKTATGRLMNACLNKDPRIEPIREFFGTLNGTRVTGYNRYPSANRGVGYATSDSSHLWHVHISIFREYVTDAAKMRGIADVLNGVPLKPGPPPPDEGDDMPTPDEVAKAVWRNDGTVNNSGFAPGSAGTYVSANDALRGIMHRLNTLSSGTDKRLDAIEDRLDALIELVTADEEPQT